MEKVNKDEVRMALIEGRLIEENGTVNTTTVNYISGLYTLPLINEVWDLYLKDVDAMAELQAFLNELYENEQYNIIIGVLKLIYSFCSLIIPDEVQMIFDCGEKELNEVYLYEFLEDFVHLGYVSKWSVTMLDDIRVSQMKVGREINHTVIPFTFGSFDISFIADCTE